MFIELKNISYLPHRCDTRHMSMKPNWINLTNRPHTPHFRASLEKQSNIKMYTKKNKKVICAAPVNEAHDSPLWSPQCFMHLRWYCFLHVWHDNMRPALSLPMPSPQPQSPQTTCGTNDSKCSTPPASSPRSDIPARSRSAQPLAAASLDASCQTRCKDKLQAHFGGKGASSNPWRTKDS